MLFINRITNKETILLHIVNNVLSDIFIHVSKLPEHSLAGLALSYEAVIKALIRTEVMSRFVGRQVMLRRLALVGFLSLKARY